jgi:glutamyl-tRNA reductase
MISNYKIITISYHNTNLKDLGKFILPESNEEFVDKLSAIKEWFGVSELLYISTCNRVMFILYGEAHISNDTVVSMYNRFIPNLSDSDIEVLKQSVGIYVGIGAIQHIFKVASSVDSLVVGERQIVYQLRNTYNTLKNTNICGDWIRILMENAFLTSKEVFNNTKIGKTSVSIASLAVFKLMKCSVNSDSKIILIGAGQTNHTVAKILRNKGFTNVSVFNRTLSKAETIAKLFPNGKALLLSDLKTYTEGADIIISCISVTEPVVGFTEYTQLVGGEITPKIIVDLAVPNNIVDEVARLPYVDYIDVESLRKIAHENKSFRESELTKAAFIIYINVQKFNKIYNQRRIEILFNTIPSEIRAMKENAITNVFKKDLENMDESTIKIIDTIMTYMEKKCIGIPMKIVKEQYNAFL